MGKCKLNVGGVTTGKYVWIRRYYTPAETVSNLSFKGTEPMQTSGNARIIISDENFDISRIGDFVSFFNGFKGDSGSNRRRFYIESNKLYFTQGNMAGSQVGSFNKNTKTLVMKSTTSSFTDLTYTYTLADARRLDPIIGDLKDYVVSNNPDAYPNGGEKGGFYYELLGSVPQATSYGISEVLTEQIKDDTIQEVQNELNK